MTASKREFDIILYGATGFVGKLTANTLPGMRRRARVLLWPGVQPRKLSPCANRCTAAKDWPIVTADASSPSTLQDMAARTRVVVTTVGPYARYGLPLVAACAAAGTDYVDLTGESQFIRESIDRYHKQAAETGARILHSCGFDSVPSDMTVYALHRRALQDGAGDLRDATLVLRSFAGGVSGGTTASMLGVFDAMSRDAGVRRQLVDPYTLSPDRAAEPELGAQPDVRCHAVPRSHRNCPGTGRRLSRWRCLTAELFGAATLCSTTPTVAP
jgi:short subunit dehydrogenase-like uncharacterized protein